MKISIDSRTVKPGDYYIPVKGPNFDGRDFINDAIKKGATILDVDLETYAKKYRKSLKCPVIAICGSAGKTTVKDLISSVLGVRYVVEKTFENQNNEIGVPLTILQADAQTEILIVEMGMRNKGDLKRLAQIVRPTHVIMTSIGKSHIVNFSSQREIAIAKSEVYRPLVSWENKTRTTFLNYSSLNYKELVKKAEKKGYKVLPFSGEDKPDQNINLCYLIGGHFGLNRDEIGQGIRTFKGSQHRMVEFKKNDITLIDDTYNANPDGVCYALQAIRRTTGRKIFVFGDMLELGKYAEQEHQKIIDHAIDADISLIYAFGDQTKAISSGQIPIYHFEDKEDLNKNLLMELKKGDTVLIKGSRGMKMEQTFEYLKDHV